MGQLMYLYTGHFKDVKTFREFNEVLTTLPNIPWRIKIHPRNNQAHGHIRLIDQHNVGKWLHDDLRTISVAVKIIHSSFWYYVPQELMNQITPISDQTAKAFVEDAKSIKSKPADHISVHALKAFLVRSR